MVPRLGGSTPKKKDALEEAFPVDADGMPEQGMAPVVHGGRDSEWPWSLFDLPEADLAQPYGSHVEVGHATMLNLFNRHSNEDRVMCHEAFCNSRRLGFYTVGVLDGHDTDTASDTVARQLPAELSARLKAGDPVVEAYTASMADMEERLKSVHTTAGTCVLSCTIAGSFVWCANLGDCRACLVPLEVPDLSAEPAAPPSPTNAPWAPFFQTLSGALTGGGGAVPQVGPLIWISRDQKAGLPHERQRIEAVGGVVVDGRVDGLEPSRTLGDFDVKSQVKEGVISIVPEVRRIEIRPRPGQQVAQALLVCATDGVWDVLRGEDIVDVIVARKELVGLQAATARLLTEPGKVDRRALDELAEDIVTMSAFRGSQDDCTAVVALISVSGTVDAMGVPLEVGSRRIIEATV